MKPTTKGKSKMKKTPPTTVEAEVVEKGAMSEFKNPIPAAQFAAVFLGTAHQLSPEAQVKAMEMVGEIRRSDELSRLHSAIAELQKLVGPVAATGKREKGITYAEWEDVHNAIHPVLSELGLVLGFERYEYNALPEAQNTNKEVLLGFAKYRLSVRFRDGAECVNFEEESPVVMLPDAMMQDAMAACASRQKRAMVMNLANVKPQDPEKMKKEQTAENQMAAEKRMLAAFNSVFGRPLNVADVNEMAAWICNAVLTFDPAFPLPKGEQTNATEKKQFYNKYQRLVNENCRDDVDAADFCKAIKSPSPEVFMRVFGWEQKETAKEFAATFNPLARPMWQAEVK